MDTSQELYRGEERSMNVTIVQATRCAFDDAVKAGHVRFTDWYTAAGNDTEYADRTMDWEEEDEHCYHGEIEQDCPYCNPRDPWDDCDD